MTEHAGRPKNGAEERGELNEQAGAVRQLAGRLKKDRALKVISTRAHGHAGIKERFLQEITAAAALDDHENVVRALDGPLSPMTCVADGDHPPCAYEAGCKLKPLWSILHGSIQQVLERTTLEQVATSGMLGLPTLSRAGAELRPRPIVRARPRSLATAFALIAIGSLSMGSAMARIHQALPALFPEPASYPYLDAFTTVLSFAATILMAHKNVECWYLWIAVDVIGIGLYFVKGVVFVAALYVAFLVLAIRGLLRWSELLAVRPASA